MDYSPLAPDVIDNPYPYYSYLREHAPVYWIAPMQAWALSRYADVDFALRNPQVFSSSGFTGQALGDLNPTSEIPWILDINPLEGRLALDALLFDCPPFTCTGEANCRTARESSTAVGRSRL